MATKSLVDEALKNCAQRYALSEKTVASTASFGIVIGLCGVLIPIGFLLGEFLDVTGLRSGPTNDGKLDPYWKWLTEGPLENYTNHAVFPGILSVIFFFISVLPAALLDLFSPQWCLKYKIQQGKFARPGSWKLTIGDTVKHNVMFILPNVVYQVITRGPWMYRDSSLKICIMNCDGRNGLFPSAAPSVQDYLIEVLLCLVLFDGVYHYWHRMHHNSRVLYKNIHSIHHQFNAPFVFVTQYEHPLELFAVGIFSVLVPIAVGVHPLSEWTWLLLAVYLSVDAHTGYDFGVLDKFCWFWGGTVHHDRHHMSPRTNYQPFFTWFDYYHGTVYSANSEIKKTN